MSKVMGRFFSIDELSKSDTAIKKGIDNIPPEKVRRSLEALIDNVLDPLRAAYGKPITVNSGYRSPALNKAVGGAAGSQHLSGEAADISVGSRDGNKQLLELACKLELPFDQLIDEKNFAWVHISYGARNRRQVLRLK